MIRRPPRSTRVRSSAASDVYKRQDLTVPRGRRTPDRQDRHWQGEGGRVGGPYPTVPTPYRPGDRSGNETGTVGTVGTVAGGHWEGSVPPRERTNPPHYTHVLLL